MVLKTSYYNLYEDRGYLKFAESNLLAFIVITLKIPAVVKYICIIYIDRSLSEN